MHPILVADRILRAIDFVIGFLPLKAKTINPYSLLSKIGWRQDRAFLCWVRLAGGFFFCSVEKKKARAVGGLGGGAVGWLWR